MDTSQQLLDAVLDAWDRNQAIMLNLLRALPPGGLDVAATSGGAAIGQQFAHICHERLISVFEEAPEHARAVPAEEWPVERDPDRLAAMLTESAASVRAAVHGRVASGRSLDRHYDHPILMLQLLLWHEAYHHGQIKLTLKLAGQPIDDDVAGPLTWDVWRQRRSREAE